MSSYQRFISEGNEAIVQTEQYDVKEDIWRPTFMRSRECLENYPNPTLLTKSDGFVCFYEYFVRITVAY
jgi:hypothetical protein